MSNNENKIKVFFDHIKTILPETDLSYQEHLADNDVLLPHVFMGEVTRIVIRKTLNDDLSQLQEFLKYIDAQLCVGDEKLIEIIQQSFVENLLGENEVIKKLMNFFRPNLGALVKNTTRNQDTRFLWHILDLYEKESGIV